MEVSDDIIFNIVQDMRKKDIHPVDRGILIKEYANEKGWSIRQMAKKLDMSHSTLADWVDPARLTKEEYDKLRTEKGLGKLEIYKLLRNSRSAKSNFKQVMQADLNIYLQESIIAIRPHINNPIYNDETVRLISDLKNVLNRLELHIDQKVKKGISTNRK